ncbi:hypothetical protein OBV_23900 [Oscillibacter valericigenes Sjm18-20]|nr:hypothetical protein OBV_23900 [Oscillibacter valericigenes Sjm18-20]
MFSIYKMSVGTTAPFKYLPGTAGETIEAGEALALASGKLTKCGATVKPAYIALGPKDDKEVVPCAEVQPYMEFLTTLSADGAALNVGDKVTLGTDGMQVTATTTEGVATIKSITETAAGGEVVVSF